MPFIGNQPALSYTSFAKQDFTTSATTSYTLDQPVANANELALFINFVRQEPTTAYTASGTTLTLTSATSASDDMYCVFLGKAVQTVNPPSGSVGLSQLSATGTPSSSTFLRGDNSWQSAGGANTPAFHATNSATQNLTSGSYTKVQFNTETYDDGGVYDNTTNYRFSPGQTGRFFIYYRLGLITSSIAENKYPYLLFGRLYVNGSQYDFGELLIKRETSNYNFQEVYLHASGVVNVTSASDYFELYALATNAAGAGDTNINTGSFFGAYKLIT